MFVEVLDVIFMLVLDIGIESFCIDVVFDVYFDEFIKNVERVNCGLDSGIFYSNIVVDYKVK